MEKKEERRDFNRRLFSMVVPLAFQGLMTAAVNASDAIMLGFWNQTRSLPYRWRGQITFVFNLFITVLVQGTTLLAAQYWGHGNRKSVEMVLGLAIKYSIGIAVVFTLGAVIFPRPLMRIFTTDPVLIDYGTEYLKIAGFLYGLNGFSQMYLCIMKTCGKTTKSTVIGSSAMILNLILNTVLIFGLLGFPAMRIKGAAIATVIVTFIQTAWVLIEAGKKTASKYSPVT